MKKKCPECGSDLLFIGDIGIVHWDDVWEAECMRYTCLNGHMIFSTQSAPLLEAEVESADEDAEEKN